MKHYLTFLIIIFFSTDLYSQDFDSLDQKSEFAIGIWSNYSIDSYSFDRQIVLDQSLLRYKDGTGNSFSGGIDFLWRLNRDFPSWQNSVLFSAGYSSSDFTSIYDNQVESLVGRVIVTNPNGSKSVKLVNIASSEVAEAKHEYLFFSSNYRQQILDLDLHISLGINLNFLVSSELSSKMNLLTEDFKFRDLEPDEAGRLTNDNKTLIFQEGKDPDAETYVFYLPIGIDYEFSLYDFSIIPQIQYSIPLTKMNVELDMARSSYVFGLKVLYNIK